jgi:two-component system, LytTR family, sensor kinase
VKDRWLRIIGIPLIAFTFPFLYHKVGTPDFYWSFPVSFITTALIWEGTRFFMLNLRRWLAWNRRPMQHILVQAILSSIYSALVVSASIYVAYGFIYAGEISPLRIRQTIATGVMLTLMMNAIYEGIYFSKQWRANFIRGEVLRRTNLRTQFESLKHQVNPHFLFNSLNTLATLIEEDPVLAKRFVAELSKLYQYVLETREHSLVSLEKEIDFVETYVFLLQMRFGENLLLTQTLSKEKLNSPIPPLTLQLLAENAVKHNIISEDKPLHIMITESNGCINVSNNIQKKTVLESSTGIGLKNIIERYRYFSSEPITIDESEERFIVCLPVLASETEPVSITAGNAVHA